MFLIGLTGSAIPYLLFMGVLIVLALGTDTRLLDEKSSVNENEKLISLETTPDESSISDADFVYTSHPYSDQLQLKKGSDDICKIEEAKFMPDDFRIGNHIAYNFIDNSNFQFRYFGLSPPCWA